MQCGISCYCSLVAPFLNNRSLILLSYCFIIIKFLEIWLLFQVKEILQLLQKHHSPQYCFSISWRWFRELPGNNYLKKWFTLEPLTLSIISHLWLPPQKMIRRKETQETFTFLPFPCLLWSNSSVNSSMVMMAVGA